LLIISLLCSGALSGQSNRVYTEAAYDRAASMLSGNVSKLIDNQIRPEWLPDGRLWYKSMTGNNVVFKLFNPADKKYLRAATRQELFDYTLWGLFLSWLPAVGDIFAVGLGLLRANILITAIAMLAGKFLRYVIWGWLTGLVF